MGGSCLKPLVAASVCAVFLSGVCLGASLPKPVIKKIRPAVVDSEGGLKIHVRILVDCPTNWVGPSHWRVRFLQDGFGSSNDKHVEQQVDIADGDLKKGTRELRVRFVKTKAQIESEFGVPATKVNIRVALHSQTPGMSSSGEILEAYRQTPWPLLGDYNLALHYIREIRKVLSSAKSIRDRNITQLTPARRAKYDAAIQAIEKKYADAIRIGESKTIPNTKKADDTDDLLDGANADYRAGFIGQ